MALKWEEVVLRTKTMVMMNGHRDGHLEGSYTVEKGKKVTWWPNEYSGETTSPRAAKRMVEKILRSK